jgi:acyl-CoA dehydrogenase
MPDTGIVCYGKFNDQDKVLGIKLNWEKRYITLGPIATVLGLAFKLYDPDHLLGNKENVGITAALIPTDTPGVSIGRRHFPLDSAFQNGPNWGKDVFIPMDWVIGGADQVGNGWSMLMQCLSTGRAISLPALSVGASKLTCRNSGAYARIRKQFNLPIGEFEGIEEVLARMAGQTYILDAARQVTNAALDQGEKPSVISAILKYELTERMRKVVNDGMDIQGGSGICLGPQNFLGRVYQVIPVSITVEGANILTRTMMIFGQGAVRCHPYIQQEMAAIAANDLALFDRMIFRHLGHIGHNKAAALWLGLTNARLTKTPGDKDTKRYYRQIARYSAGFAFLADYGLMTLGGTLKRKERISGRYADALGNLYLCSCVLKHYENQGSNQDDLPLLHWACQETLYNIQEALADILTKLPFRLVTLMLHGLLFPLGKMNKPPREKLIHPLATILTTDNASRNRLTQGVYINENPNDPTGKIEVAFKAVLSAAPVETKIKQAQKQNKIEKGDMSHVIEVAVQKSIITKEESTKIKIADNFRFNAISVDDFDKI